MPFRCLQLGKTGLFSLRGENMCSALVLRSWSFSLLEIPTKEKSGLSFFFTFTKKCSKQGSQLCLLIRQKCFYFWMNFRKDESPFATIPTPSLNPSHLQHCFDNRSPKSLHFHHQEVSLITFLEMEYSHHGGRKFTLPGWWALGSFGQ